MLRILQTITHKSFSQPKEKPRLRKYQVAAIEEVLSNFHTYSKVVLSAAPSAGKTFMSLHIVNNLLNDGIIKNALIIAHGQVVLKNQWIVEKPKIIDSEFSDSVQIEIAQNLNKIEGKPDFIVVDEAHQFYFANMIQTFLSKHPDVKCLLLTGTPSKFIYQNDKAKLENKPIEYPIVIVDAASILEQGYLSDLGVMAVSTNYDLDSNHFTESMDLNEEGLAVVSERATDDFKIMMEAMIKHLKMLGFFKVKVDNHLIQKVGKLAVPLFSKLHKTQIACASVEQARSVYNWLNKNGVRAVLSEYEEDRDSEKIKQFVEDEKINVLVVVNRAVLGFNLPDLVNVVDMTGSRNIDRIYQLLSRVTRKSEEYPNKFFFKLSNSLNREVGAFYLEAALCLMFKEFVSRYNGKNLGGLKIPVEIKARREKGVGGKKGGTLTGVKKKLTVPKALFETVQSVKMLKNILHNADEEFSVYKMVTFQEIERDVLEIRDKLSWTREMAERKLKEAVELGLKSRGDLVKYKNEEGKKEFVAIYIWCFKNAPDLLDKWFPSTLEFWTREKAEKKLKEALELGLKNRNHLMEYRNSNGEKKFWTVYLWCLRNVPDLLDRYFPLTFKIWTREEAERKLREALKLGLRNRYNLKKYRNSNGEKEFGSVYGWCCRNAPDLLDKYFPITFKYLTKEKAEKKLKEALKLGLKNRTDLVKYRNSDDKKEFQGVYSWCQKNAPDLLDQYFPPTRG